MKRAFVIFLSLAACHESPAPPAPRSAHDVVTAPAPGVDGGEPAAASPAPVAKAPAAAAPKAKPVMVRILIKSIPPKAKVTWGKAKLGVTPVRIERLQSSEPLDLTVKLDGYFPVHTRAYTFKNEVMYVKMTRLEDRMTIFGARAILPPPSPSPSPAPPPPF